MVIRVIDPHIIMEKALILVALLMGRSVRRILLVARVVRVKLWNAMVVLPSVR